MTYNFDEIIDRRNTDCLKYDFATVRQRPEDALPMWVADMDFRAPQEVTDALICRATHGIFGYSEPREDYFNALHHWFHERHDWNMDTRCFVPSFGVVNAISTLLRVVTEEGDAVIISQPVYYPFEATILANKRRLVVNELLNDGGRYRMDLDKFEQQIVSEHVKAFILCSPHNPVGRVWTRQELEAFGEICLKHGVFIIADEIHADFTYSGQHHIVFATLSPELEKRCAVCTAPTKTFNLAGLHIANTYIADSQIRTRFIAELDRFGYSQSNIMGLTACHAAYTYGGTWYDQLKVYLEENLRFIREYTDRHLAPIKLIEPEGTYLVWMDCRELGMTDKQLSDFMLYDAKLWLDDGTMFGKGGSGFERINIACPRAILSEALCRLSKALNTRK